MIEFYIFPFLFGIVSGCLLLYVYANNKHIVVDYPKIDDSTIYTDKNGVKFTYVSTKVDCDSNESTLKEYKFQ